MLIDDYIPHIRLHLDHSVMIPTLHMGPLASAAVLMHRGTPGFKCHIATSS